MELNKEEARMCYIGLNALQQQESVELRTKLAAFVNSEEPKAKKSRHEPDPKTEE
jgi:hypothetical protein